MRRRCSIHELRRNPVGQIMQYDVFGQEVACARGPGYRMQPHALGLGHIRRSISGTLHRPERDVMPAGLDLRVWTAVSTHVAETLGHQISRVDTGNAREPCAEPDAGLLSDEHHVGRTATERIGTAAGERRRSDPQSLVSGPADPGDHPARWQRPRAPERRAFDRGRGLTQHALHDLRADMFRDPEGWDVTTVSTTPLAVHQVRRTDVCTATGATDRDTHTHTVGPGQGPVKRNRLFTHPPVARTP